MKKKKSLRRFQSPVADLDCPQARIHAKESRTCNVFRNAKKCSIQWLIRLMIEWNNDTLQVGLEPLVGEIPISLRSKNPQRTGAIRDDLWRFTRPPPSSSFLVFNSLQTPWETAVRVLVDLWGPHADPWNRRSVASTQNERPKPFPFFYGHCRELRVCLFLCPRLIWRKYWFRIRLWH